MRQQTHRFLPTMARSWAALAFAVLGLGLIGCGEGSTAADGSASGPRFAYVTNGVASFWTIAEEGAMAAGRDLGVEVELFEPGSPEAQQNVLEDLVTKQVDGIAISPIDPVNQITMLNRAAKRTRLITHDSDSAESDRLCFIGVDNYVAGRMCGELVREALPDGGEIMIFIGRTEQDNARRRRQGVIDGWLGRTVDANRADPLGAPIRDGKFVVLGTQTDQFDRALAKANAEDALTNFPELDCMVGLFAYNSPACLKALEDAGRLGDVKVVAFDEEDGTLQGIRDGHVFATVAQDPFGYGYRSIELLTKLHQGATDAVPDSKWIVVPARKIYPQDVEEFWADLKSKRGQ